MTVCRRDRWTKMENCSYLSMKEEKINLRHTNANAGKLKRWWQEPHCVANLDYLQQLMLWGSLLTFVAMAAKGSWVSANEILWRAELAFWGLSPQCAIVITKHRCLYATGKKRGTDTHSAHLPRFLSNKWGWRATEGISRQESGRAMHLLPHCTSPIALSRWQQESKDPPNLFLKQKAVKKTPILSMSLQAEGKWVIGVCLYKVWISYQVSSDYGTVGTCQLSVQDVTITLSQKCQMLQSTANWTSPGVFLPVCKN